MTTKPMTNKARFPVRSPSPLSQKQQADLSTQPFGLGIIQQADGNITSVHCHQSPHDSNIASSTLRSCVGALMGIDTFRIALLAR
jgi:hypothetical protein